MVVRAYVGYVLILPALDPHPHNAFVVFVPGVHVQCSMTLRCKLSWSAAAQC